MDDGGIQTTDMWGETGTETFPQRKVIELATYGVETLMADAGGTTIILSDEEANRIEIRLEPEFDTNVQDLLDEVGNYVNIAIVTYRE